MKILFVNPTHLDENRNPVKYKKAYNPPLVFAILHALTPDHHVVEIINDVVEYIDFSRSYDLVAITAMTAQAERAYQIADAFRNKGIKVVIGGMHASALPQEAKLHADVVVIGEADNIWEQILDDCEHNRLKDFYQDIAFPDLQKLIIPKWDNMNMKIYPKRPGWKLPVITAYATRGCPLGCKFCSVTKYFGKTYRTKPVDNFIKEIDSINADYYFIVDDNITFNPDYSRELFKALSKKNIKWMSQTSTTILKKPDLIDLAAKAGCNEFYIGVESIDTNTLSVSKKKFNKVEEYEELFQRLLKAGITPNLSFIFGFDEDTYEQFQLILEFLKKNRIYYVMFYILTPLPGTAVFEEMKNAGRIRHFNWSKYDSAHVVFQPKHFTEEQLSKCYWDAFQKFYSFKNIIPHAWNGLIYNKKHLGIFFENLLFQPYFSYKVRSFDHPYSGGFGKRIG